MLGKLLNIYKQMNQLVFITFLLTTNLSRWLIKQTKKTTVLTVSKLIKFDLFNFGQYE